MLVFKEGRHNSGPPTKSNSMRSRFQPFWADTRRFSFGRTQGSQHTVIGVDAVAEPVATPPFDVQAGLAVKYGVVNLMLLTEGVRRHVPSAGNVVAVPPQLAALYELPTALQLPPLTSQLHVVQSRLSSSVVVNVVFCVYGTPGHG